MRPLLSHLIETTNQELLDLTSEQTAALDQLRRNRRALVLGRAGTGKTLLAAEKARQFASQGFNCLLVCFNQLLRRHLEASVAEPWSFARDGRRGDGSIYAFSFHSLCRWQARDASLEWPEHPNAQWWSDGAPELLVQAVDETGRRFHAIVVDEGQDFRPGWWEALQLLLEDPEEGPFYVFADTNQAIYVDDWAAPPWNPPVFELRTNCRNAKPIADLVAELLGEAPESRGAPGPAPEFLSVSGDHAILETLRKLLHRFVREEAIAPEQIVILVDSRDLCDALVGMEVGNEVFTSIEGSGITVETIHRFKGLESDLVISVFTRDWMVDVLAYEAVSRARAHLVVIADPEIDIRRSRSEIDPDTEPL